MAMHLSEGGARGAHSAYRPMSEINVTPMVDVMLVLLIVFMVTAPLMTVGVPVDLPKSDAGTLGGQDEPLIVSVNSSGEVFLQETKLKLAELAPRLVAISGNNPEARIFIRGDQAINYGRIMEVMSTISAAGFNRVGLVARTSGEGQRPNRG
ncbi:MAG: protein TolR [Alphaproteobacteria bacterium]|nr:protein TolR [Alphaproteobacteria bacterium]